MFQCDFLALTPEVVGTKIDAVWDIQSLVSINPRDRKQYVRTLRSARLNNIINENKMLNHLQVVIGR